MKYFITMMALTIAGFSAMQAESLQYSIEPVSDSTVKAGTTVNIIFLTPDGLALDSDGVETTHNYNVTLTGENGYNKKIRQLLQHCGFDRPIRENIQPSVDNSVIAITELQPTGD